MDWVQTVRSALRPTAAETSMANGELACGRHGDLAALDAAVLARIAEAGDEPFERRLAAGTLLARIGDPRIGVEAPALVSFAGGPTTIGLDEAGIDAVLARWGRVGVRREWLQKECPAHAVTLAPFALARYPVTNLDYSRFLAATGSAHRPTGWSRTGWPRALANHPVWGIPAEAADAYAAWLAQRTGRPFRLPGEAEWEFAAAGTARREYPWGEAFDAACANTAEAGCGGTTPVGIFPAGATPEGLFDLAGNVEEYTADRMRPYPGGRIVHDLHRRTLGEHRVTRGGSFLARGDLARCRRRHGALPGAAVGFRLALSLPAAS